MNPLFTPFEYKGLKLKNRIVMAPMTRGFSPDGVPTQDVADYYMRRAEGDVGLIISEGTVIDRPASSNNPNYPHFYGEQALAGWQQVIKQVHSKGGAMAPQIWHQGIVKPMGDWMPPSPFEGPSGLVGPDTEGGVAMSLADIEKTIAAYASAAKSAKALGFDCVEIHGAHGDLIDQFFWAPLNERKDGYGGATLLERSRFAMDVVKAVRASVGADFPIILRLSQWKQQDYTAKLAQTPEEMEQWLNALADAGVDIFHCSQRRFWDAEFEGSNLNFAGWAKKFTGKPTIAVGSVGLSGEFLEAFRGAGSTHQSIDNLLESLERKEFDLVAVGRALLADPAWAQKIKDGRTQELRGFSKEDLVVLR